MTINTSDRAAVQTEGFGGVDPTWAFMLRLRRVTRLYTAAWAKRVSTEVTSTQFGVLNFLKRFPGENQKTLGEHLAMDKSNMTDVVTRLTKRGHIRVLKDPKDARRNVLMLTPDGLETLEELRPLVQELRAQAFHTFAPEDRAIFLGGMDQLIDRLEVVVESDTETAVP